jgi:cytochrome P450
LNGSGRRYPLVPPPEGPRMVTVRDPVWADKLLRDPHLMTSAGPAGGTEIAVDAVPTAAEFMAMWYTNRADHAAVSALLRKAFTVSALEGFADPCAELAARQVARLPRKGDLVRDYLSPALLHGLLTVLGMPVVEWPRIERATAVLVSAMRDVLRGPDAAGSPGATRAFDVVVRYLAQLTDRLIDGEGDAPFLTALRGVGRRKASRWPSVAVLGQVLMAGTEPMVVGAAQTCLRVWADPALRAGLRDGSLDADPMVEDVLLKSPPFPALFRFVRETCDCMGDRWPAGTVIAIDISAAHSVGRADRPANGCPVRPASVLTFGRGEHYCLGATAARVQIGVVVRELAVGAAGIVLDHGKVRMTETGFLRKVRALPYSTCN